MFINNFNKIIISELKYVLSEIPEEDRNVENLIEKFSQYIGGEGSVKPKKEVKIKPALPAEIRCNALKKDGDQCNGRKNNKENPEVVLCSLHVRSGAKFGYIQDAPESSETEGEPSSSVEVPVVVAPKKAVAKRTRKAKTPEVVVEEEESVQDVMNDLNDLAKVVSKHTDCDDNKEEDFE